ncbi:MAG: hypothetical protein PWR07_117 [Bacillota bacterium]|nr:hypothetical protein [Bacillota bacterium]
MRLDTGPELGNPGRRSQGLPREGMSPLAGVVGFLALVALGAAIGAGMMAVGTPADMGSPPARATGIARPAIPERWRELQKPLPAITYSGKHEEPIPFPARSGDDPFAPDSILGQRYRTQQQHLAAAGPDGVSRIIAAASARSVPKPSEAAQNPAPKGEEKPSSQRENPIQAVATTQLAPTPAREGIGGGADVDKAAQSVKEVRKSELAGATEDGVTSGPAEASAVGSGGGAEKAAGEGKEYQAPALTTAKDSGTAQQAPPTVGKKAAEPGAATGLEEPPASEHTTAQAAPEKPSAGSDAGKPGTAKPWAIADKGGPTATGTPDASKGPPTVKESGRESVPPESLPPPRPRVEPPLMLVTGIISAGDSAYAIVRTPQGSSIVRPGDEVGGVTVKFVGEKSITVIKEGEEFVLELGGGSKR